MSDYQKVEIKGEETPAMKPEQVEAVEQEAPQEIQTEQAAEQRPEWLPEKFKTPEALAFAYNQLEQEFSKSKSEPSQEDATTPPIEASTFEALTDEFNETGDVSEASRAKLAEQGIPRQFIDEYIEGQKQIAETAIKNVYDTVGGEENYKAMLDWASKNLPESEIDLFNDMVAGSRDEMMMAISGLSARYIQAGNSNNPPLVQGETSSDIPQGTSFQSRAQVVEAMSDPRYRKDPAYREDVYRRLNNSNVI